MNAVVAQARTYLGVPFRHRGRTGRGLDCAGLVWRAYADLGCVLPDVERYGREPHRDGLMDAMRAAFGPPVWEGRSLANRSLLRVGDVVVLRFEVHPHHIAIVTDDRHHGLGLIHAYSPPGGGGRVLEHGLDARWQSQIVAVFRKAL